MLPRRVDSRILRTIAAIALLAAGCGMYCSVAAAQTLLNEVQTIAAPTTAVPVEETFSATTAGTYTITLTDLGAALTPPAPLASVTLAVTDSSDALVGSPLAGAGTLTLSSLAAGTYELHVVGMPGSTPGSGPIGIQVTGPGSTQVATFQDALALPAQPLPNGEGVLDDSFTVSSSGTYTVTLTDFAMPQSLSTLTLLLIASGGTSPLAILPVPGSGAVQTTVALTTGTTYDLFAVGAPAAAAGGGLYGAVVTNGSGVVVYGRAVAAGTVNHVGSAVLTTGSATLAVTDLKYPAALSQLEAVATLTGQSAVQLSASGSQAFTASSATYEVFTYAAAPAAAPAAGSYAVQVTQGGRAALATARAVTASGSDESGFDFDSTIAAAGSYNLSLADFQFPAALSTLSLAVVQGSAIVGKPLTAAGNAAVSAATGPISLIAFAQAGAAGGLFGIDLAPAAGGAAAFETTQAVGTLFSVQQVAVTAAGSYSVTATDLGFPAGFATYDTIVTQGTQQLGSIFGGGTFNFAATAGIYSINFLAQPSGSAQAGTFALTVAPAPPPPVVNLSVDNPQVGSGGTVDLIWSTQNATSCTASGGWSGAEPTSGTVTSNPLTSDTTFTLSCSGPGGTVTQSVKVTVTPASSGGGGGALDTLLLLVLTLLWLGRTLPRVTGGRGLRAGRGALPALIVAVAVGVGGCGGAQSRFDAYLKRGEEHFAAGEYSKASVDFRNAMQIEPRNPRARLMAGRTFEKLARLREAIGLYQSAVDLAPENADVRAHLARVLLFAGAAEQAMKTLEPALKAHPDDPVLLTLRGVGQQKLGNEAQAIADVDRALKLDPDDPETIEARAGMYRHDGDIPAATALVGAAVKRQPGSLELNEALADLYLAGEEPAKAEEQLRRLIALAPREPRYRYQLARFYVRAKRLADAQKVLEDAVAALPANNEVKIALVEFISTQRTRGEGEQLLRDFIAREPDNNELRLGLGELLQRSGALPEAIGVYQEVAQRDRAGPQGLVAQDRMARIAWGQGRAGDADKLIAQVLEASPRDNDALLQRGEMALVRANPTAAIADLRAVLRDQPQAVGVYRLLASALAQNGDTTLAEETLRNAMDLAPADTGVRVDLAKVLLQAQRPDRAVSLLEETVQRAPADAAAREELTIAYLASHDYTRASTAAQDLGTLRPQAAAGPYLAGLAAEGLKQPGEAQMDFERALSLQPRAFDALAALARLMLSRGEGDQAIAQVRRAADRGPPDAHLLNLLGEMYLAQHNVPLASDTLTRATTVAPDWWIPYRNLALAKVAAHDIPGAIAAYQASIRAAPAEPQAVTELALFYESQGRSGDAIALYQDCYRRNPRSQIVANNLALLLVRYRTDQASLDQARDLSAPFTASSDGRLLDTNGWVHFKRAEYAQALPVLERAVERQPNSPEFRYHLGMAEWRSGNSAGARKDLEAALAASARFAGADDARAALAALRGSSG